MELKFGTHRKNHITQIKKDPIPQVHDQEPFITLLDYIEVNLFCIQNSDCLTPTFSILILDSDGLRFSDGDILFFLEESREVLR